MASHDTTSYDIITYDVIRCDVIRVGITVLPTFFLVARVRGIESFVLITAVCIKPHSQVISTGSDHFWRAMDAAEAPYEI